MALPAQARPLPSEAPDSLPVAAVPQPDPVALMTEIGRLQGEINALRTSLAPLDRLLADGVNPLMACGQDTVFVNSVDPDVYRAALDSYRQVKPFMRHYDPYRGIDLDGMVSGVQRRLGYLDKIERAQALLVGKSSKASVEKSITELDAVLKADDLSHTDREAVDALRLDIQKDYNWGGLFKKTIDKLATRPSLPDEEAANAAFEEAVKGIILAKLTEVYGEGCERLPENLVKLNDILFQLIDATRDYSFSQYRDTVSSDSTYKEWLKSLKERL